MESQNTDKTLWISDTCDAAVKLTAEGAIGIRCGNRVVVKSPEEWHRLARMAEQETAAWLVRWHDQQQRRSAVHRHNAVADWSQMRVSELCMCSKHFDEQIRRTMFEGEN